jgi:Uma2 family endonuclease
MITLEPITLSFKNVPLSDDQFYQLCQDNENWRLERTAQGELISNRSGGQNLII